MLQTISISVLFKCILASTSLYFPDFLLCQLDKYTLFWPRLFLLHSHLVTFIFSSSSSLSSFLVRMSRALCDCLIDSLGFKSKRFQWVVCFTTSSSSHFILCASHCNLVYFLITQLKPFLLMFSKAWNIANPFERFFFKNFILLTSLWQLALFIASFLLTFSLVLTSMIF